MNVRHDHDRHEQVRHVRQCHEHDTLLRSRHAQTMSNRLGLSLDLSRERLEAGLGSD